MNRASRVKAPLSTRFIAYRFLSLDLRGGNEAPCGLSCGSKLARDPVEQGHEAHVTKQFDLEAALTVPGVAPQALDGSLADRGDQHPVRLQLRQKFLRFFGRGGGDHDAVEGGLLGPPLAAVAEAGDDV